MLLLLSQVSSVEGLRTAMDERALLAAQLSFAEGGSGMHFDANEEQSRQVSARLRVFPKKVLVSLPQLQSHLVPSSDPCQQTASHLG